MQPTQPMRSYEHTCGELIPDVVHAFGMHRLNHWAQTTCELAADAPEPEQQAVYMTFLKRNLLKYTLYEQDGVAHLWSLVRSDDGQHTLHVESNDHRFPYERYDLTEAEAWDYMAEPMRSEGCDTELDFSHRLVEPLTEPVQPLDQQFYTPRQLADRWGYEVGHVRSLIRQGKLDAVRLGRRLLIVKSQVVQAFERSQLP